MCKRLTMRRFFIFHGIRSDRVAALDGNSHRAIARRTNNQPRTMSNIQVREGINFEWLDDPSTPNRRWRARMSREVFAALVIEKLGADRGDSFLTNPAVPRRRKQGALP